MVKQNKMKELIISDHSIIDEITELFKSNFPVAIFEFSGVYGLLAANSEIGVNAINQVKNRLPNKYYSSIIGNSNILNHAVNKDIALNQENILEIFEESIL